jgi:hypothetical protein
LVPLGGRIRLGYWNSNDFAQDKDNCPMAAGDPLPPEGRLLCLEPYGGAATRVTHAVDVRDFRLYVR